MGYRYPKDSDKHMLAKQTGLTRSQVLNSFPLFTINLVIKTTSELALHMV